MKKTITTIAVSIAILAITPALTNADTLKDGTITYSPGSYLAGQPIGLGVDPYGYNYQARRFAGSYFNSYANGAGFPPYSGDDVTYLTANPTAASYWAWPYRNDQLSMKWNDAWLSNEDRDNDGKLDRHYGYPSYVGSGAWLNNMQNGEYLILGETVNWNYFVKIVAVPNTAVVVGGTWYDVANANKEIGPSIWGEFAITQEVYNDPGADAHGVSYHSPAGPGLGKY